MFLDDPYHGYSEGNFTDNELLDVSKLFLDFIKQVDACQNTICKQLDVSLYGIIRSITRLTK